MQTQKFIQQVFTGEDQVPDTVLGSEAKKIKATNQPNKHLLSSEICKRKILHVLWFARMSSKTHVLVVLRGEDFNC